MDHSSSSLTGACREISLLNADEEEQGQETPAKKKKKRKAPEPDGENDVEKWVLKRQKLRSRKAEEAVKTKRTVFVGNLPIGCTKKVEREQDQTDVLRYFLHCCL